MQLPQQQIKELKTLVVKNYGVLLSDNEVNEFGESLLRLTRVSLNSSAKRIESDLRDKETFSTIEKTRSHQQVCEITKPAVQQGVLLRPKNGAEANQITPRGSVFPFRPSARGDHLVTDSLEASSIPETDNHFEENGYLVNPSRARDYVFSYIRSQALGLGK
jgi:hypothetical protein